MHDQVGIGLDDFAALPGDGRCQLGVLGDLGIGQQRIEAFGIEIVINDLVPRGAALFRRRFGNRVAETAGALMAKDHKDFHCFFNNRELARKSSLRYVTRTSR